ncbi:putative Ig domain-containing protein [Pinirhizobacter soli]|uniref:putative Ig domain-containing protein n=1 Tax=Pinirhizobacter soli TaxID=2786953 RepID=UPI002029BB16|nr:putative Ig domain-containing protein [Pinirhizobacter soli]
MRYRPSLSRLAARFLACIRSPHAWALTLALLLLMPGSAWAAGACPDFSVPNGNTTPSTSPMASGGTIVIDVRSCDSSGFGIVGVVGGGVTTNGHVTADTVHDTLTYVNNGNGQVTDSFAFKDDNGVQINVTVSIAAASSIVVSPSSSTLTPTFGTFYSQALSATGGTPNYSFVLSSGSLPGGLSFSTSTNTISGTPNQAGTFPVTFTVTDSAGTPVTATKSYSIVVGQPTIVIGQPPSAAINSPYSFTLSSTGGTAPYTYTLHSGSSMPPGLSLSSGGVISGTPTTLGSYSVQVESQDSSGSPGPYTNITTLAINVVNQPPTAGAVSATVAYNSTSNPITLNITGPTATGVAVGTAPTHGTATASGTSITYTPTTGYAGPDTFTYTASNGAGSSTPANVTITVSPPTIVYAPANPAGGTVGLAYSQSLAGASGGATPYTYTIASGALPAGLTLAANGTLSGTATAAGTFTFQVKATDSSTGPAAPFTKTTANLSLTIAGPTITLTPATLTGGTVNSLYSQTITASGGTSSYTYALTSGTLPTGITLTSAGLLSGTTTQAGSFPITITATDSTTGTGPFSKPQNYTLTIAGPTIAIAPASLPNGTVGTGYNQTLSASGGTAPYTFSNPSANLPAGLSLGASGTLSGTPTTAGDYTFSVIATDAQSFTGSRSYTVHVAAIAPGAPTSANATAGDAQASVAFAAPTDTGGAPITGYTVTSSPGNKTGTGAGSPIVVTGLTNGTAYTFTVVAANIAGPGPASAPSNSVTPQGGQTITFANPGTQNFGTSPTLTATATSSLPVTFSSTTAGVCSITSGGTLTFGAAGTCTIKADQAGNGQFTPAPTVQQSFQVNAVVPGAPGIGTVVAGDRQVQVNFSAPASLGGDTGTITYTATSSPGGNTGTSTSAGSITVASLTNGTAYTFTVTATNTAGTGSPSAASASVTPKGVQTITFNQPPVNFGAATQLGATTNAGLQVSYTSITPSVCTVTSTGALTTVSPGNCTIDANQAGNVAWLAAPQVQRTFAVVVPGGAVTLNTTPLPVGTGGTPYSATFTATGGATPYTFTETGALPTGLTMTSAGTISGTPTSAGTYPITVKVTDAATQTAQQTFQLTINAPGIALAPATLPQGKVAVAYASTTLTASGGSAPYSYAVTAGALPAGLTLSPAGVISGTPTAAGPFNITVTATDKFNFQGTQAYTIAVDQPTPIVVNQTASTGANSPLTIPGVIPADTGPITSLTITQQPAHGTATVSGLNIIYTPTHDYFGSDTLKYTATGPGGTSAPATVVITVAAGAVPVPTAQGATVLAGKSVTIHAAAGAANGPFTAVTLVGTPATGTASVQGTDIVYTADPNASGTVGFDFTLSNAFGASAPAHVTVTVNARPVAANLTASVMAGLSVQVDLTTTARGGPFTAAKLMSISPANAGSATVQSSANGGYTLSFTAAPTFGGVAQVSYTLSNAFATSDPGSIAITVTARSDPSKNAEVLGVLDAQADSTRRMALGQINNFQRRLEALHSGSIGGFSNGVTFSSASSMTVNGRPTNGMSANGMSTSDTAFEHRINGPYAGDDQGSSLFGSPARPGSDDNTGTAIAGKSAATGNASPGGLSVWTGGAVNFGKMQPGSSDDGIDFTTSGLSMGADKQVTEKLALGAGLGYGHDVSDIGQHTSRSTVDSYNVAMYGSYRPTESVYADALVGYQWLSFDARRYVTDNGNTVHGSRDGKQWFASFSMGYQHSTEGTMLTPYGRLDIARANLEGYTETGDAIYSLKYQGQDVNTSTATVGVLAQWTAKRDYGTWAPQLRAEFGHDLQGSSQASMRYADLLNGPSYQATLQSQSRNHTMLGAGVALQTLHGWMLRFEYQNYLDNTSRDNQSILLGIEKKFGP